MILIIIFMKNVWERRKKIDFLKYLWVVYNGLNQIVKLKKLKLTFQQFSFYNFKRKYSSLKWNKIKTENHS